MFSVAIRLVLVVLLAIPALALPVYGVILIAAWITGSSDTAPGVLIGFGVACIAAAIVAGSLAWMLSRTVIRFYRD